MKVSDELEGLVLMDSAGCPDLEFEEFDESGDEVARELDLLAKCVRAARECGA